MQGLFINLPAATLTQMATDWGNCLQAIATAHQSYSIAGRQFTRADLKQVADMVAEIAYAQKIQAGTLQRTVRADMSNND